MPPYGVKKGQLWRCISREGREPFTLRHLYPVIATDPGGVMVRGNHGDGCMVSTEQFFEKFEPFYEPTHETPNRPK